jgi:hypothetical protein
VARGQTLRFVRDAHEILQPAPDEAKSGGGPILPRFSRPAAQAAAPTPDPAPDPGPPGVVYDREGNPYVEAE